MFRYALKRLGLAILVMVTVSIISFALVRASGDIAIAVAGEGATNADIEAIRHEYGFDRPLVIQYLDWASDIAVGNFGESLFFKRPVLEVLFDRMPVTLMLGFVSLGFAMLLAIPLGTVAALRPNSIIDRLCLGIAVLGQATPSFWFALLMILVFGVMLRVLPVSGTETWKHFVLPVVVLGYYVIPAIMRLTRAGMIEVLEADYIRTAKAKGLNVGTVVFKHGLRNAIIPVVSLLAVQLGFMLGGSVVVETIFSINGVGHLALVSIERSDFPMIQGIVLVLAILYILLTLFADLLNGWLDPRIRVS